MVEAKQQALDAVPPSLETVRGRSGGGAEVAGGRGWHKPDGRRRQMAQPGAAALRATRAAAAPLHAALTRLLWAPSNLSHHPMPCNHPGLAAGPGQLVCAAPHVWAAGGAASEAVPRPCSMVPVLPCKEGLEVAAVHCNTGGSSCLAASQVRCRCPPPTPCRLWQPPPHTARSRLPCSHLPLLQKIVLQLEEKQVRCGGAGGAAAVRHASSLACSAGARQACTRRPCPCPCPRLPPQIPYVIEKVNMRCYGDKPPEFMAKVGFAV